MLVKIDNPEEVYLNPKSTTLKVIYKIIDGKGKDSKIMLINKIKDKHQIVIYDTIWCKQPTKDSACFQSVLTEEIGINTEETLVIYKITTNEDYIAYNLDTLKSIGKYNEIPSNFTRII